MLTDGGSADHRPLAGPHGELAFHPRRPVAGQRAEVRELAALVRAEHGDAAGALPVDLVGAGAEVGEHDVVLHAVVVDEGDLHDVTLRDAQRRIDDALDGAAHADEGHLAVRQLRAETEAHGRRVLRGRALLRHLGRAGPRALGAGAAGFVCAMCRWPTLPGSAASPSPCSAAVTANASHATTARTPPRRVMIDSSLASGCAAERAAGYDADHIWRGTAARLPPGDAAPGRQGGSSTGGAAAGRRPPGMRTRVHMLTTKTRAAAS